MGHTCVPSNRTDQTELRHEDGKWAPSLMSTMLALSPPRKQREQDPDAPNTGASDFSLGSVLNSIDSPELNHIFPSLTSIADGVADNLFPVGSAPRPELNLSDFNPLLHVSIESEYNQIIGDPAVSTTTASSGSSNATPFATSASTASTTSAGGALAATPSLPPLAAAAPGAAWKDMPVADAPAVMMPEDSAASHISFPASKSAESSSYEVVDGLIELSSPDSVNAPKRIEIFCTEFGQTKADGKPWSREDIAFRFNDMTGHGKKCLVHDKEIKSGSSWHCKGTGVVACAPCKVLKVLKQIGTNLHVEYQGGIPRMILDIATSLNLHNVDYRDLQLILDWVTVLGTDMTSCIQLWAICLQDASGYIAANKRFYGCFMHPLLDHRPASDKPEHSGSKGLANLWHATKIWKGGKYLTFTHATRYRTGDKMEERSAYKKDVIDASTEHVKKNRSDWVDLAKKSWTELESVRNKLFKKSSGKKRTRSYEEEEEEEPAIPGLPMPGLPMLGLPVPGLPVLGLPMPANGPAGP